MNNYLVVCLLIMISLFRWVGRRQAEAGWRAHTGKIRPDYLLAIPVMHGASVMHVSRRHSSDIALDNPPTPGYLFMLCSRPEQQSQLDLFGQTSAIYKCALYGQWGFSGPPSLSGTY